MFDSLLSNMLNPAVLFFALGMIAGWIKSDLDVPESISRYLAIYLMMAIGFKGGVALADTRDITLIVGLVIACGVALSFAIPFLAYGLLRLTTPLDRATAAAVAAHYGSISMVTFVTAASFLSKHHIPYEGYIVAVLALMEAPAILSGLFIAHRAAPETIAGSSHINRKLRREIFTNGSILLLTGAFVIGFLSGDAGMAALGGFLQTPFQGILALFLLDMGLVVARQFHHVRHFTPSLLAFSIYMPLLGALIGALCSMFLGLDRGTATLFIVLIASASYIAVPAAIRLALPQASPAIYLPLSLGLTFPFNLTLGIPFYYWLAGQI